MCMEYNKLSYIVGAWPSVLERWIGDSPGNPGFESAAATSLRHFGNSAYPALPVSFGGEPKNRRSLHRCLCQGW